MGNVPVTGLRLRLEGARSNRLAIQLQHLTSLPMGYQLSDNATAYLSCDPCSCNFHRKVKWNGFAYVCTAPVESYNTVSIVTGAQLHVERNCLLLRLRFSKVVGATLKKPSEWDQSSLKKSVSLKWDRNQVYLNKSPKWYQCCGLKHWNSAFSCMSAGCECIFQSNNNTIKKRQNHSKPKPGDKTIGSSPFSAQPPAPVLHTPELQRFVDTTEIIRGPEDTPGYWVVSGAGLSVHNGEINLRVKYSLLSLVT